MKQFNRLFFPILWDYRGFFDVSNLHSRRKHCLKAQKRACVRNRGSKRVYLDTRKRNKATETRNVANPPANWTEWVAMRYNAVQCALYVLIAWESQYGAVPLTGFVKAPHPQPLSTITTLHSVAERGVKKVPLHSERSATTMGRDLGRGV